jgi:hypothetical protein
MQRVTNIWHILTQGWAKRIPIIILRNCNGRVIPPLLTDVPSVSFQSVEVSTASEDREGRLVLIDGKLAAVLVRLADASHDPLLRGAWYLEAGFGLLSGQHGLFASLEEAVASIEAQLSLG